MYSVQHTSKWTVSLYVTFLFALNKRVSEGERSCKNVVERVRKKKNIQEFNEYRHLVSLFLTQSSCLFFFCSQLSASSNNLWASFIFSTNLSHQVRQHWIKPHAVNKHQIWLLSCNIFLSTRVTGTLSTWTALLLSSIHILTHF